MSTYPRERPLQTARHSQGLIVFSSRQILPESHTLGQLHPHSLALELSLSSRQGLQASLALGTDNQPAQILAHELCHWIDLVGTVWGQEYLDSVFAALDCASLDSTDAMGSYPTMLRLFDLDRAILFPTYYKVIDPAALPTSNKNPWVLSCSCGAWINPAGKLDESKPIFFVRFNEGSHGPQVARQPLSVGALLELRATAAEIATFEQWLQMQPSEEQAVASKLFRGERMATFYDPKFTTYSAAAHLLSFCTHEPDFAPICQVGGVLADLCLNIVPRAFSRLRPPAEFRAFTPQRLAGFRQNHDRGYLFACLAFHAKEVGIRTFNAAAIGELIAKAGLGKLDDIYGAAEHFFDRRMKSTAALRDHNLRRVRTELIHMGAEILRWRRSRSGEVGPAGDYIAADMPSPVVMTNDGDELHITSHGLAPADCHLLHRLDIRVRDLTRSALRAGRGLDFGFLDYIY